MLGGTVVSIFSGGGRGEGGSAVFVFLFNFISFLSSPFLPSALE